MNIDGIYGALIGCALGNAMGNLREVVEHKITSPYDSLKHNLQCGWWSDAIELVLQGTGAAVEHIDNTEPELNGKYDQHYHATDLLFVAGGIAMDTINKHGSASEGYKAMINRVFQLCEDRKGVVCHYCSECLVFYSSMVHLALQCHSKAQLFRTENYSNLDFMISQVVRLLMVTNQPDMITKFPAENDMISALEVVIYVLKCTDNFVDGMKLIVNHGACPSRTASLYGQLAGAFYGLTDIPHSWIMSLANKQRLRI
jgi:ADP-ribosylglycohydrolase